MVSDEPLLYRSHAGEVASVLIDQKHLGAGAPRVWTLITKHLLPDTSNKQALHMVGGTTLYFTAITR